MEMSSDLAHRNRLRAIFLEATDETILRGIFRGMVAIIFIALLADFGVLQGWIPETGATAVPDEIKEIPSTSLPAMPSILAPLLPGGDKRLTPFPSLDSALGKPMTFDLVGGGRLMATGTITPGISDSFAAEVGKHGDYIKTVVLNSPGGSVEDALKIGRLIRDKKFATEVEAKKFCASSCPLIFASGSERRAGDKAVVGVHQITAMSPTGPSSRDDMSIAQSISARCQRYLSDMGINLQVWVHAMETPHDKLFVFNSKELKAMNLTTTAESTATLK